MRCVARFFSAYTRYHLCEVLRVNSLVSKEIFKGPDTLLVTTIDFDGV